MFHCLLEYILPTLLQILGSMQPFSVSLHLVHTSEDFIEDFFVPKILRIPVNSYIGSVKILVVEKALFRMLRIFSAIAFYVIERKRQIYFGITQDRLGNIPLLERDADLFYEGKEFEPLYRGMEPSYYLGRNLDTLLFMEIVIDLLPVIQEEIHDLLERGLFYVGAMKDQIIERLDLKSVLDTGRVDILEYLFYVGKGSAGRVVVGVDQFPDVSGLISLVFPGNMPLYFLYFLETYELQECLVRLLDHNTILPPPLLSSIQESLIFYHFSKIFFLIHFSLLHQILEFTHFSKTFLLICRPSKTSLALTTESFPEIPHSRAHLLPHLRNSFSVDRYGMSEIDLNLTAEIIELLSERIVFAKFRSEILQKNIDIRPDNAI